MSYEVMKGYLFMSACVAILLFAGQGCTPEGGKETKLSVPTGITVAGRTETSLTFSWNEVEGAKGYTYRFENGNGDPVSINTTREKSATLSGLDIGTLYRFVVKANASSPEFDSAYSEPAEGTTVALDLASLALPAWENDDLVRAFPGAEGGGMFVTGGRGGAVYHVTNLNDSGTGSLRDAVDKTGPRTIVFDVAGTIRLKSRLTIRNGNLTIAGQTAPGDGICLRDNSVYVGADNIIIRYVRFRMGDATNVEDDAIWGRYQKNIILDHCSMSWSTDECASFYANQNFTMQWCLLTESLRISVHGKGSHGYGGIWGGRNASFHHNMLANHDSRNARLDHPQIYGTYLATHRGNVDFRNNVIYNWGGNTTYGGEDGHFNVVGNYYKPGPASANKNYFVDAYNNSNDTQYNYGQFYLQDNLHAGSYAAAINADNRNGGLYAHQGTGYGWNAAYLASPLPIKADDTKTCHVSTHPSSGVFDVVVSNAGASLSRDAVDVRAATDARSGTATFPDGGNGSRGGIIDTQEAVGGWPEYSGTPGTDTDKDGMPDEWENRFALDPNNPADGNLKTLDTSKRYTNLEMYLWWIVRDITLAQCEGGSYTTLDLN